MTDDDFAETSARALKETVTSSAVLVATTLGGPGAGLMTAIAVPTAFDWFERRASGRDGPVKEGLYADVAEQFRRLDEAVERLRARLEAAEKRLDRQDMLTRDGVYSEFAKAVAEAATPEKREALVNAAARQFDPTFGSPAVRDYWIRRVRELPDLELEVVKLMHEHGRVAFDGAIFAVSRSDAGTVWLGNPVGSPTRSEVVALEVRALTMSKGSDPDQLLLRAHEQISVRLSDGNFENKTTSLFGLTPSGDELAKFITD